MVFFSTLIALFQLLVENTTVEVQGQKMGDKLKGHCKSKQEMVVYWIKMVAVEMKKSRQI